MLSKFYAVENIRGNEVKFFQSMQNTMIGVVV